MGGPNLGGVLAFLRVVLIVANAEDVLRKGFLFSQGELDEGLPVRIPDQRVGPLQTAGGVLEAGAEGVAGD